MAAGDEHLHEALIALRSSQKQLVLLSLAALGAVVLGGFELLRFLRPFGLYGSIHCIGICLMTFWQDVPDRSILLHRQSYQEHAHLMLSAVGCAIMATCSTERSAEVCRLALVFILPALLLRQVQEMKQISIGHFGAYLAMHFAMVCAAVRTEFWSRGWQLCIVSLAFDILVLSLVQASTHVRKEAQDVACYALQQVLSVMCDGSCLMSDPRLADLVGAGPQEGWELEGLPFGSLLAPGAQRDKNGLEEGMRTTTIRLPQGTTTGVETYTRKCPFSLEFATSMLDRNKKTLQQGAAPTGASEGLFLRLVRRSADVPEPIVQKKVEKIGEKRRTSDLSASANGSMSLLSRHRRSEVSSANVISDLSSTVSKTVVSLKNVRLQMMSEREKPVSEDGAPLILELDLPQSEVGSVLGSLVSDSMLGPIGSEVGPGGPSPIHARMRLARRRDSCCLSSVSGGSEVGSLCSGPPVTWQRSNESRGRAASAVSTHSEDKSDLAAEDPVEDLVSSEVISLGAGKDGRMRLQVGFRSKLLQQQSSLLNSVSTTLESVRRQQHVREGVQEEQKEVLRRFQKIVSREVAPTGDGIPRNVTVFIFEERPEVRASLKLLCQTRDMDCQAFAAIQDGLEAMQDWHQNHQGQYGDRGLGEKQERLPSEPPKVARQASEKGAAPALQLVLLSANMLKQLPSEWSSSGIFVALVGRQDELAEVGRVLLASSEVEARERLRSLGVSECLPYPLPPERLTALTHTVLQRRCMDDYLLVGQLGRGGTATVYSAKRLRDGEAFALKEINLSRLVRRKYGQEDLEKVWAEAEFLRALRWPTVLTLVDAWQGKDGKLLYMLMPCLDGGNLQQRVEIASRAGGQRVLPDEASLWFAQALHGLSYLHWCGVLHRDVKTENMLLAAGGRLLRLGDLGSAARLPGPGPHPARRNFVKGPVTTPQVNAPEVIMRDQHYAASDLWSLAAAFYEVITLRSLLPATGDLALCERLVQGINMEAGEYASVMAQLDVMARSRCESDAGAGPPPTLQVARAWPGNHDAGAGPSSLAEATPSELLRRAPCDLVRALAELLRQDHMLRPSAAELAARPSARACLECVLAEASSLAAPGALEVHMEDFDRLVKESEAAAGAGP